MPNDRNIRNQFPINITKIMPGLIGLISLKSLIFIFMTIDKAGREECHINPVNKLLRSYIYVIVEEFV